MLHQMVIPLATRRTTLRRVLERVPVGRVLRPVLGVVELDPLGGGGGVVVALLPPMLLLGLLLGLCWGPLGVVVVGRRLALHHQGVVPALHQDDGHRVEASLCFALQAVPGLEWEERVC